MKSEEFFEMLNGIDDNFVDAALPKAEESHAIEPQEIRMTKRHFPWVIAAAAAGLAVCAAVGTVIAVNMGKGKIPVESTPTQSGLNALAAEEIYVGSFSDSVPPTTFTMEEFGKDVTLTIDEKLVIRTDENGDTTPLIGFPRILRVHLGDLNGDGKREIIAEGWNGLSGLSANYIQAYDLENSKYYTLAMAQYCHDLIGDCGIEIKDGIVYARLVQHSQTGINEIKPLTLDMMFEVDENYNPEVEVVLDENVHNYIFTMPEYPDFEFCISDGDISVYNKQTDEHKKLLNTNEIKKVYLYDDYCTYKRDIYVIAKRIGEQNTVGCYIFLDKDGNFSTTYIEPNEKGYDMDMKIKDGRPMMKDLSPASEQKIESAENDNARLSVGIPKSEYKKGEIIDLTAEVYNKSDKTFYIVSPTSTREAHKDILTTISLGENELVDMDAVQSYDMAMEYIPVNPGELYSVVRRFDTSNAEVGVYGAFSTVVVTDAFNADVTEDVTVKFQIEITSGASDEPTADPVTSQDPSESTEPEPLFSFFENDKLRLQADLEKYAYKKGDIITVDAKVTNKSDKKFHIFVPTATANTHTEIRTYISLDGRRLNDIDAVQYWDDGIVLIPLEPGESYSLKVRFDTTYTGDESLGISKQPVQSGTYHGVTTVTILDSPGFETPGEDYSANFAISIM